YPAQIWKTGQTTSYKTGDDGDLERGVAWPSPRFTDHGNTVTDNLTGLMWIRNANLPGVYKTWQQALDYVKGMNAGTYDENFGYTDWRLPNRKELHSLTDYSRYNPAIPSGHPPNRVADVEDVYRDVLEGFELSERLCLPFALIIDASDLDLNSVVSAERKLGINLHQYHRDIAQHVLCPPFCRYQREVLGCKKQGGDWASIPTILASPVDYLLVAQYRLLIYFLYCCIVLFSLFVSRKVLSKQPIWLLLSTSMLLPFVSFRLVPVAVLLTVPIAGYAWTQVQPDESTFPSSLIAFLKTNQLGGRIFNTQRIGAFLSWGLSPDDLTFTDTRDDLFLGTTVLSDLEKTFAADTDVQSLLMKYPADIVVADVAESKSFESLWYSPMWVPVYFSGRYGVFIPPERASALHLAVLSGIDPFSASGAKPKELTTAISTYQRLIDNQPYAIALNILLARSSVAAQQWQNALRILTKLPATTSPSARLQTMDIASLSVWSYLGAQNCAGAKQTLDRLDSLRRKALVFQREVLPSDADKGYAFYFVLCAGNVPKANTYLSRYLRSAGLSLEEKRETVKEFSNLVSSSAGKQ
ncbi:MAG: DUF1566 domain-containing protein, partial [Candidatus Gottesmanbacteria bacterium]|nr:DUF1566 domain-containing protein [Candidatus Gottesmanbacteria bacterium]